jgi:tetratricopeptide (TPR) repeat protein
MLADCELQLARTISSATQAEALLAAAQRADDEIGALAVGGLDLRAERARLSTIQARIERADGQIVRALGGAQAFVQIRKRLAPGESPTGIWSLDARVAQQRIALFKRIGALLLLCVALVGLAYAFRDVLLPPDPVGDAIAAAGKALDAKDPRAALAQIELGLGTSPSSTRLLIWRGVLQNDLADPAAAERSFAQAETIAGRFALLLERATIYTQLLRGNNVMADVEQASALAPAAPEPYLLKANGHELLGQRAEAITALERCAELAEAAGNSTLTGVARVRIGQLMASGGGGAP